MKIMIMSCSNNNWWYKDKISCRYVVKILDKQGNYKTKDGTVLRQDAVVMDR